MYTNESSSADQNRLPIRILLDTFMSRFIKFALRSFVALTLAAGGVLYVALFIIGLFEYGDGIHDLSVAEWLTIVAIFALGYRHNRYCKRFGYNLWDAMYKPVLAFGRLCLLVAIPLLCYFIIQQELGRPFGLIESSEMKIFSYLITLLTLYLATPHAPKTPVTALTEKAENSILDESSDVSENLNDDASEICPDTKPEAGVTP